MAFLGLPPRCSKRSAEEGIKEVGGPMTGARDKILSRDCGRRSHPGWLPDQSSPQPKSSVSWNASTQDAIDLLKLAPYGEAGTRYGRACW